MAILYSSTQKSLAPLIEQYNLTPRDNREARVGLLNAMLNEKIEDPHWVKDHLKPELEKYRITYPSQQFKKMMEDYSGDEQVLAEQNRGLRT